MDGRESESGGPGDICVEIKKINVMSTENDGSEEKIKLL